MTPLHATLLLFLAFGLPLGVLAGAFAGRVRWWPGRIALGVVGLVMVWAALVLGVANGFAAWQAVPDPPKDAFADGGPMVGALFCGWLPSAIVVGIAFGVTAVLRRRSTSSADA